MKLLISFLLFIITNSSFATFQIDSVDTGFAEIIKKLLVTEYSIPENLILIRKVQDCGHQGREQTIAHMCINEKGELKLLSFKKDMINHSLEVFRKREVQR